MLNFLLMRSAFCRGVLFGRHHCHSPFSPHSPTRSLRDSEAAEEARVERCVVDIERWMTNKKLKNKKKAAGYKLQISIRTNGHFHSSRI